jgi:ATP/maltotriose-dependent transcriptional regulator MalT
MVCQVQNGVGIRACFGEETVPAAEVRLAKLSRPRVGHVLARERLFASLDRLRERPVVWIAAQPGAGKTTLLASYVDERELPCLWYQVDGGDADPASFFYHMGMAAQGLRKRKRERAPMPLLTPEFNADLPGFARHYFRALYERMGPGSALVLDNLHEVPEDRPLHRILATAFEEVPEGVGAMVSSRGEPPGAYSPLIARDRVSFIDSGEIRLTLDETEAIASGARTWTTRWCAGSTSSPTVGRRGSRCWSSARAAGSRSTRRATPAPCSTCSPISPSS